MECLKKKLARHVWMSRKWIYKRQPTFAIKQMFDDYVTEGLILLYLTTSENLELKNVECMLLENLRNIGNVARIAICKNLFAFLRSF